MVNVFMFILLLSLFFILHTYVLYPLYMLLRYSNARETYMQFEKEAEWPRVAVLIAAYNEEAVIREKILSVFNTHFPQSRLKVFVGSDASVDRTETLVEELKGRYPNLELVKFSGRVGKINIINHLQSLGEEDILVMTDANVMFEPNTIPELVKYFKDERIGIVAANIVKQSNGDEGIARQEKAYLSMENKIKAAESNAFGIIMGAEGGCYAIRNSLFSKVPSRFIVDDFFITLQVILKGNLTLFNPAAICTEDVSSDMWGEYRRKLRISSGNFQNLFFFKSSLIQFWKPIGFCFWSHKVLRWLTPFFLITAYVSSAFLALTHPFFCALFLLQTIGLLFPLLHKWFKFENSLLKFISHFYMMNLALLGGFFRFVRGIKSSIWQPVKRNV